MEEQYSPTFEHELSELLMSKEEYAEVASKIPHDDYEFALTGGGKGLHYVGLQHTYDPSNLALTQLEENFYRERPTTVFVEGITAVNKYPASEIFAYLRTLSRDEVISRHGEPMFTLWLAAQTTTPEDHVSIYCPEPAFADTIIPLEEEGYSREDILAYHIYRLVPQYVASGGKPDITLFKKDLAPIVAEFFDLPDWDKSETMDVCDAIVGDLDLTNVDIYSQLSAPIPWSGQAWGASNEVAARTSVIRDIHIVKTILAHADKKTLVVYGFSHAVMQEPALRHFIGKGGSISDET